jgi:hypothetical protein
VPYLTVSTEGAVRIDTAGGSVGTVTATRLGTRWRSCDGLQRPPAVAADDDHPAVGAFDTLHADAGCVADYVMAIEFHRRNLLVLRED